MTVVTETRKLSMRMNLCAHWKRQRNSGRATKWRRLIKA